MLPKHLNYNTLIEKERIFKVAVRLKIPPLAGVQEIQFYQIFINLFQKQERKTKALKFHDMITATDKRNQETSHNLKALDLYNWLQRERSQ